MKAGRFKGGIHPPGHKKLTERYAPSPLGAPEMVFLPVSQHIGAPAKPCVEKRDRVLKGQVIAQPGGFVSVPIHSPVSGTVMKIDLTPHVMGPSLTAIHIENDGQDQAVDFVPDPNWESQDAKTLIARIQAAGLVGLGGATFPTHVKLSPPKERPIDTVILNGAECEPYLTADHRLMLLRPVEVVAGLRVFMRALGLKSGVIAVENNKPDAILALQKAASNFDGIEVVALRVMYPQGAEKQLIKAITGREVPCAGLPMDVGCLVQNVATAAAAYRAVAFGEPLISRYCTVTGDAVNAPSNLEIVLGTPIQTIINACGGLTDDVAKVIAGGPMMGIGLSDLTAPAIKGTGGLLCLGRKSIALRPEHACIRCGNCVSNCPMGLAPTTIALNVKHDRFDQAEQLGAMDCIECGCCSYGCPSCIPLVQYIRIGKAEIINRKKQRAS